MQNSGSDENSELNRALVEYMLRIDRGETVDREAFLRSHPEAADELRAYFADEEAVADLVESSAEDEIGAMAPLSSLVAGQRFGDYELIREIACGGMGVVCEARQHSLQRTVALKLILGGQLATPAEVERFHREAEMAADLRHPNIVAVHEVGEHLGHHYFAMDYIAGRSLAEIVRETPLSGKKAAQYLVKVTEAIRYAHDRGVLHRDLKPSNILIDAADEPHVTDFGLAKRVEGDSQLTATGVVLGSPSYMSPEQAGGRQDRVGPASDIYGLGATLYELLTGRPPFRAESPVATVLQVLHVETASPRVLNASIDRDIETICLKCLDKEPSRRYASAEALADDLRHYLAGEPIHARPVGSLERLRRWCKRKPVVAALIAMIAASLVGGAVVSTYFALNARARAKEAVANAALAEANAAQAKENADRAAKNADRAEKNASQAETNARESRTNAERADANAVQAQKNADEAKANERKAIANLQQAEANAKEAQAARDREKEQRLFAEYRLRVADSLRLASQSRESLQESPQRSLLLAVESVTLLRHPGGPRVPAAEQAAEQTLRDVLAAAHGPRSRLIGSASLGNNAAISLQKRWLIASVVATGQEAKDARMEIQLSELTSDGNAALPTVLRGHQSMIDGVAFTDAGHRVVTIGRDRTARTWKPTPDGATSTSVELDKYPFKKGDSPLVDYGFGRQCPVVSPNGRWLVMVKTAGPILLWDLTTKERVAVPIVWKADEDRIHDIAISPDSRWLATGGGDGAKLWDLTASNPAAAPVVLPKASETDAVTRVSFSPDGRQLTTLGIDKTATIWDLTVAPPTSTTVTVGEAAHATCSAVSGDGRWLVAGGDYDEKKSSWVWNLAAKQPGATPLLLPGQEGERVFQVAIGADGRWAATSSMALMTGGGAFRIWDLTAKDLVAASRVVKMENQEDAVLQPTFSPDGRWLAGGGKGVVRVWDLAAGGQLTTLRGHDDVVFQLAFSPDSRRLVTGSMDKTARVWDLTKIAPYARTIELPKGKVAYGIALCGNQRRLAAGTLDGSFYIWDIAAADAAAPPLVFDLHASGTPKIVVSEDGRWLATAMIGSYGGKASLLDLTAKDPAKSVMHLPGSWNHISSLAISPDNRWLAISGVRMEEQDQEPAPHKTQLWDLRAMDPAATPTMLSGGGDVALSANGRWLAMEERGGKFQLWDISAPKPTETFRYVPQEPGKETPELRPTISPDSRWLAIWGDYAKDVQLWNLAAIGKDASPRTIRGRDNLSSMVSSVAFSPDGHWLATGSKDSTVRLWDLSLGDPTAASLVLRGHENAVREMAISPDSRWLVTMDERGIVRTWNLALDDLIATARRVAGRGLTAEERKQYLLEEEATK